MKNLKKISSTLLFLVFTTISNAQNYAIPEGFRWTDKQEYLYSTDTKEHAIEKCKEAFSMHSSLDIETIRVYENSKVPIFWYSLVGNKRKKAMIFYCIKYRDGYDVVIKQIEKEDTYFFSVEENNGEVIDLFYAKQ